MNKCVERLYNGVIKENPTFVLMLGMCPTLAVTTSAINGLGMGLSTMVVLALSNMLISALRKIIPDKVRIPAYIVIIATFVTVVELLMHAYLPDLYSALGIYIALIVVNCIILGRAESYASKNPVLPSLFDGIGMGLGFTLALTLIGLLREFLGAGTLFGIETAAMFGKPFGDILLSLVDKIFKPGSKGFMLVLRKVFVRECESFSPIGILVMAPGAFFVLATLTTIQNYLKVKGAEKGKDTSKIQSGCGYDCANCTNLHCEERTFEDKTSKIEEEIENDIVSNENIVENEESVEAILSSESEETIEETTTAVIKDSDNDSSGIASETSDENPIEEDNSLEEEKEEKEENGNE